MTGEAFCDLHCSHTWQCEKCGALVHGKKGSELHLDWHARHDWLRLPAEA